MSDAKVKGWAWCLRIGCESGAFWLVVGLLLQPHRWARALKGVRWASCLRAGSGYRQGVGLMPQCREWVYARGGPIGGWSIGVRLLSLWEVLLYVVYNFWFAFPSHPVVAPKPLLNSRGSCMKTAFGYCKNL